MIRKISNNRIRCTIHVQVKWDSQIYPVWFYNLFQYVLIGLISSWYVVPNFYCIVSIENLLKIKWIRNLSVGDWYKTITLNSFLTHWLSGTLFREYQNSPCYDKWWFNQVIWNTYLRYCNGYWNNSWSISIYKDIHKRQVRRGFLFIVMRNHLWFDEESYRG